MKVPTEHRPNQPLAFSVAHGYNTVYGHWVYGKFPLDSHFLRLISTDTQRRTDLISENPQLHIFFCPCLRTSFALILSFPLLSSMEDTEVGGQPARTQPGMGFYAPG